MIQTPQFRKIDTTGPIMNATRQYKSPIQIPDYNNLFKFNSQNPYNLRGVSKFGSIQEHKDSSLYDSSSGSSKKKSECLQLSARLKEKNNNKSPETQILTSINNEPKSILKNGQDAAGNINEQVQIIFKNTEKEQISRNNVNDSPTSKDYTDVGEEWIQQDGSKGLHMPKKTETQLVALSAFNFLTNYNNLSARQPETSKLSPKKQSKSLSPNRSSKSPTRGMSAEQAASIKDLGKLI